jgi:hypothetical protein
LMAGLPMAPSPPLPSPGRSRRASGCGRRNEP